jgi:hypothetical protein
MPFVAGDKVTWADPLIDEPVWKVEQRKKWEAEFGPPPYTVTHINSFRPGEDLVFVKEVYETLRSYFGPTKEVHVEGTWYFVQVPHALVQGWFKLWEK